MRIETARLIVRPFRPEDADALYRIKTDPQVMEFCPDFLDIDITLADMPDWICRFRQYEEDGDIDSWRCYAIESRETGTVVGALTFSKQKMLHEYELGWMMIGEHTGSGYASEAAAAFAEDFCRTHGIDYLIAVMDPDNPASRRTAEKSGFRLFEKRTVYDDHCHRYCDDYFYFRRYWSGCALKDRYYGDSPYYGRTTSDGKENALSFRKLTDFGRGIMYGILKDAYSFDARCAQCWDGNWRETDDFFFDHPEIAEKYGFATCFRGEPIGFICWDPMNRPEYVEIGHNAIRTAYKGNGFGKAQLAEALRRIREYDGLKEIRVRTNSNLIAPRNYESVGFVLYDRKANQGETAFSGDDLYYRILLR